MPDLPVRPETLEAVEAAMEANYEEDGASSTRLDAIAAIKAFCEAEELRTEHSNGIDRDMNFVPGSQRRIVGPWREVTDGDPS